MTASVQTKNAIREAPTVFSRFPSYLLIDADGGWQAMLSITTCLPYLCSLLLMCYVSTYYIGTYPTKKKWKRNKQKNNKHDTTFISDSRVRWLQYNNESKLDALFA